MKNLTITNELNELNELEELWPIKLFTQAYSDQGIKGCSMVSIGDESGNPDKIALIANRVFIQNSAKAQKDQKYIVGISFYGMGDMATIDVISLDKDFHKEICFEHLKRLGWSSFDEITGKLVDELQETSRSQFLFVGGHLKITGDTIVDFTGSSGDYGSTILFSDSNSIAAFAASTCGIQIGQGDIEKGKTFYQELLELMLQFKLKPDFYERLVQASLDKTPEHQKTFTPQHIGALIAMKVIDRSQIEDKDPVMLMMEEMFAGGLSRYIMLSGVVKHIKANRTS